MKLDHLPEEPDNIVPMPAELEEDEFDHSEWTEESEYFADLAVTFDTQPTPHTSIGITNDLSYFMEFFDDYLFSLIVDQTNLYALQKSLKNWNSLSIPELKAYMGCLILMGIHQLPRLENYWSSDPLLNVSRVSNVMSSKRFKKITEALHCNDNQSCPPRGSPEYDKLYKLRPLIDYLNNKYGSVYDCSSELSVDESMIPFKGRSSFKQYMPMKPVKRGYKVWCIADSQTGFVSKFDIYTGKSAVTESEKDLGLGEKVVFTLTENFANKSCLVAFDNFFTSVTLFRRLHEKRNLRCWDSKKRKNLPEMMKKKDKMNRGEFQFKCRGVVSAVKWQDNKPVTLLTTAVSPREVTSVKRTNKDGSKSNVYCPKVVDLYNRIMGGVDRFDQKRETYAIGRRSVKWWHRIFYFLVDLAIVNRFIMYQKFRRTNIDQLTYRIALIPQLISGFSSRKRRGEPGQFLANKKQVPDEVRLSDVGSHFPEKGSYRRCRICSTKANEKRTAYTCTQCKVPVCVPVCFKKLHR